jgi:ABC-type uncharacterized transport system auxiliary subunit
MSEAKAMKKLGSILFATMLAGCGSLVEFPWSGDGPARFDLEPATGLARGLDAEDWSVYIEDLTASGAVGSDGIVIKVGPQELNYYANARWSDRAPRMLNRYFSESLQGAGKFTVFGADTIGLAADYRLQLDIRQFAATSNAAGGAPTIIVRVSATLVRADAAIQTHTMTREMSAEEVAAMRQRMQTMRDGNGGDGVEGEGNMAMGGDGDITMTMEIAENGSAVQTRTMTRQEPALAGQRSFDASARAGNDSVANVVRAYNAALDEISDDLARWLLEVAG